MYRAVGNVDVELRKRCCYDSENYYEVGNECNVDNRGRMARKSEVVASGIMVDVNSSVVMLQVEHPTLIIA